MQTDSTFDTGWFKQNRRSLRYNDIRSGEVYQKAQNEIRELDPDGHLIGLMLSVDDTKLTNHSGSANGRPLYLSTANQSLESRRHSSTNSWRVTALLPSLNLDTLSKVEKDWSTVAKAEFVNRSMELALQPLIGNNLLSIVCAGCLLSAQIYILPASRLGTRDTMCA